LTSVDMGLVANTLVTVVLATINSRSYKLLSGKVDEPDCSVHGHTLTVITTNVPSAGGSVGAGSSVLRVQKQGFCDVSQI